MTMQPQDYSEVLAPWTRRGNDPAQGAFITADDALESLTRLKEYLKWDDWALLQQVQAAIQQQFPAGTLPPSLNFRGVVPSQASAPASVYNPEPGDDAVTNDKGHVVALQPTGVWVDLGRMFITTGGGGGAMTPAVKLVPDSVRQSSQLSVRGHRGTPVDSAGGQPRLPLAVRLARCWRRLPALTETWSGATRPGSCH